MSNPARRIAGWWPKAWLGLGLICGLGVPAEAGQTYLALGDSVTFGVGMDDSSADISNGDRGYVGGFADVLAAWSGGVRPKVIDLAVSGETSSSFFGAGSGLDGPGASHRNTNYIGTTPPTQDALMLATIKAEQAAGNTISTVTMTLGANDLFAALAAGQSPIAALATFQQNEITLLGQIRSLLPTTNLILLNYFDPYAPFLNDPDHTSQLYQIAQASAVAIPAINAYIQADATAFGAGYADLFDPFRGNELADTYISTGNVHPNAAGYALITTAVASVPEPASVALLGLGLAGLVVAGRCRGGRTTAAA